MRTFFKFLKILLLLFVILLLGPLAQSFSNKKTSQIYLPRYIPDLSLLKDKTIIEIYGAGAGGWQSSFSLHTWIAVKRSGEEAFTIYEVLRERPGQGLSAIATWQGNPDRVWAKNEPNLIFHMEGDQLFSIITEIEEAIREYSYKNIYILWPGPNCNTFTASIARAVPDLGVVFPPNAVGKDFLPAGAFWAHSPSGTGVQCSLFGLLGITIARKEGVEFNFLGLNFGIQFNDWSFIFPGIGKIQFSSKEQLITN